MMFSVYSTCFEYMVGFLVTTADQFLFHLSILVPDTVQMAADCQEKLQNGPLPQLETCLQCLPVHVCHANGNNHDFPRSLFV